MVDLAAPYFKVNGIDILKWVEQGGIKWRRNDVESSKAGRTMDATMHRGRVAIKFRADVVCIDMNRTDELQLMNLILPEYVTVETNLHPLYENQVATYYSNNVPATVQFVDPDTGDSVWSGITFPLIEQ